MGRRRTVTRCKPKKRQNRYNPNAPDYRAVHSPLPRLGGLSFGPAGLMAALFGR